MWCPRESIGSLLAPYPTRKLPFRAHSCHSGWHSDQGSQNPGIAWEIRLWKNDLEHYSTSFCWEFRCASSWHSHLIRSAIFWLFLPGDLEIAQKSQIHKIQVPKFQGCVFWGKKNACRRHIDHGGWECARHSHILQVYTHPTSIQTPYSYTDTLQVYSTQNTSPDP